VTATMAEIDRLLSAAEAERLLGIRAGTVRQWKYRGLLWHYGLDRYGRPLYKEHDLIALRDRTMTRDQFDRKRRQRRRDDKH
jgi:hypothetical protein